MKERAIVGLMILLLVGSIGAGLYRSFSLSPSEDGEAIRGKSGIAVVDLFGPISGPRGESLFGTLSGVQKVVDNLNWAAENPNIKAVVLRINSPGGTVGATQELHYAVKRLKDAGKKVVVSVMEVCASGGYYAACPADRIIANPGAVVGSIGVIVQLANLQGLMEDKLGIKYTVIKSGKWKDMGSPFREMTPEERQRLQKRVDAVYKQFADAVIAGRAGKGARFLQEQREGLTSKEARAAAVEILKQASQAQVFDGRQAIDKLLIDELGSFQRASELAKELAGLPEDAPVIKRPGSGLRAMFTGLDTRLDSPVSKKIKELEGYGLLEYRYIPGL